MSNRNLKNIKIFNSKLTNANNSSTKNNLTIGNIINPFNSILYKSLALPPSVKQWINSVYSYNKNFIKSLPVLDSIVNKIIKSYFSINPLDNNPAGKRSRLLVRRFNRLSLNKILISKSEIKHFNDKIFITIFIFNKRKKSLLYKLKTLYNNMLFNINSISFTKKVGLRNKKNITNKKIFILNNIEKKLIKSSEARYLKNNKNKMLKKFFFNLNNKHGLKQKIIGGYHSNLNKKLNFAIRNLLVEKFYKKYICNKKVSLNLKNINLLSKKINQSYIFDNINTTYNNSLLKNKHIAFLVKNREYSRFKLVKKNKIYLLFKLNKLKKNTFNKLFVKSNFSSGLYLNNLPWNSIEKTKALKLNIASLSKTNKILRNTSLKKSKMYLFYKNYNALQLYSYNSYKQYSAHCVNNKYYNLMYKYSNNSQIKANDNILSYKFLKETITNNISMFIKNTEKKNNNNIYIKILNYYVNSINKYKLYNNTTSNDLITVFPIDSNKLTKSYINLHSIQFKLPLSKENINKNFLCKTPLLSIDKLKALYALTSSYNNINTLIENKLIIKKLYKNNLIFTYKILKKYLNNKYIYKLLHLNNYNEINKLIIKKFKTSNFFAPLDKNFANNYYSNAIFGLTSLNKMKTNDFNFKKQIYTPLMVNNYKTFKDYDNCFNFLTIKLEKINKFFELYKNIISGLMPINVSINFSTYVEKNIINRYKAEFIKELLNIELLYIYNLRLVSFNNNIFKDWFLNKLKFIISKVYNKKVIFNFISLKYIYLNSDIFTQAIAIKLRNSRINRLSNVLSKAIKTVSNANIISITNDMHNPVYKYIENHFNKKLFLHKELFSDSKFLVNPTDIKKKEIINSFSIIDNLQKNTNLNFRFDDFKPSYLKIRRLNQIQANTINFIKHKSVFGVRIEASGRLTKRSTASRSVYALRYKGGLKHNVILNKTESATRLKNNRISNLQFTRINSKTRNGSFGLKGWVNSN